MVCVKNQMDKHECGLKSVWYERTTKPVLTGVVLIPVDIVTTIDIFSQLIRI